MPDTSPQPERRGKGKFAACVAVVLTLALLYVLSPGPVFALMNRYEADFTWLMRVDAGYAPVY